MASKHHKPTNTEPKMGPAERALKERQALARHEAAQAAHKAELAAADAAHAPEWKPPISFKQARAELGKLGWTLTRTQHPPELRAAPMDGTIREKEEKAHYADDPGDALGTVKAEIARQAGLAAQQSAFSFMGAKVGVVVSDPKGELAPGWRSVEGGPVHVMDPFAPPAGKPAQAAEQQAGATTPDKRSTPTAARRRTPGAGI